MNSEPSRPASSEPLSPLMKAILTAIVAAVVPGGVMSIMLAIKGWEGTLPGVAAQGTTGAILGALDGLGFGLACGLLFLGACGLAHWMSTLNRKIRWLIPVVVLIGLLIWVGVAKTALALLFVTVLTFVLYLMKRKKGMAKDP